MDQKKVPVVINDVEIPYYTMVSFGGDEIVYPLVI